MNYEKEYKELVGKIDKAYLYAQTDSTKAVLEEIRPELKESEDEKIIKAISYVLNNADYSLIDNTDFTASEMEAWLEKLGGKKSKTPNENIIDCIGMCLTDADEQRFKDYNTNLKECLSWLEKQGENHDDKYNITGIKSKHAEGKLGEMIKEIKSTDKVEPKFHEGQWIVLQDKYYKINYNGCGYELIDQNGLSMSLEYETVDTSARLWDITKDAKAGDILVCKGNVKNSNGIKYERICLFNNLNNAFFTLTKTSNYVEEYDINVNIDYPDDTIPATKEQRAILIKAMADAGYTFDFEKKKLKKIEDETEIPFGAKDSELQETTYYIPKGFHAEIDKDKVVIKKGEKQGTQPRYNISDVICDKLCTTLNKDAQPNMEIVDIKNGMYICDKGSFPVSQQDEYELVSKKIDTKLNVDSISNELRTASFAHAEREMKNQTFPDNLEFELIYTFEEGAKWQATQKSSWSKDDDDNLGMIESRLIDLLSYTRKDNSLTKRRKNAIKEEVVGYVNWLTSLKDRCTWKPSDAQMIALNDVIINGKLSNANERILKGLQEQLKKLK